MHGSTAINVANGMTGAFIIEGEEYDGALDAAYAGYLIKEGEAWVPWKARSQKVLVLNQLGTQLNAFKPRRPSAITTVA